MRAFSLPAVRPARQAEVRRADWNEFDLGADVWTVPAAHMKRGRAHQVPLSTGALAVLEEARELTGGRGMAFPGPGGGELGKSTVAKALARAGGTAHGFRSSFKDWARHEGVDELLSEFALAHVEGSRTVAAYARDDLLGKAASGVGVRRT